MSKMISYYLPGNTSLNFEKLLFDFEEDFDPMRANQLMKIICTAFFAQNTVERDPYVQYCNSSYDSYACWPPTPVNHTSEMPCPHFSFTDSSKNVTRLCFENGTWEIAKYQSCIYEEETYDMELRQVNEFKETGMFIIFSVGYTITTIALVLALAIFIYFRSLRCLRNTIHCHLFLAFLFNNLIWILMSCSLINLDPIRCRAIALAFNYFMSVPFYWMFVEGLYLYTTVVWTFTFQKFRLWYYILIGWGTPLVVVLIWAFFKFKYDDNRCWLPLDGGLTYDYIVYSPILLALLCNVFFVADIVWVLVTKLRASNTLETRRSWKAVRATFVLLPLLGLTFILFLQSPANDPVVKIVFHFVDAILQSLQGLLVAVIYCFMNGEVKTVLKKKFISIQESRALTRYTKSSIFSSPHRSSGYAMQQLSTAPHGKSMRDSFKMGNGGGNCKAEDPETEACASIIENVSDQH